MFLEGQFRRYGPLVSAFIAAESPHDRIDPMARLFPKVTKCTIHTFGPAGSVQTHDALCVLPLNVVNEKIFVVLWFWLVFLAGVGCLAVIYRYVSPLNGYAYSRQLRCQKYPRTICKNLFAGINFFY